jgi:hypothetical protein
MEQCLGFRHEINSNCWYDGGIISPMLALLGGAKTNQKNERKYPMKSITKILFVAGFIYAMAAVSSFAQILTFDENGHANFGGNPLPFFVGPDPSGGLAANVLVYTLPFMVTPGDVGLLENPIGSGTNLVLSDIVRFYTPTTANTSDIIFYSDIEAGENDHDLADTGLPQSPNAFLIQEVGPENNNGAIWNPVPGQPGSLPTGGTIQFNIISDVPEPGTLTLAACGGALSLAALRRRHQSKI